MGVWVLDNEICLWAKVREEEEAGNLEHSRAFCGAGLRAWPGHVAG